MNINIDIESLTYRNVKGLVKNKKDKTILMAFRQVVTEKIKQGRK